MRGFLLPLIAYLVIGVYSDCSSDNLSGCKQSFKCAQDQNGLVQVLECSPLVGFCNNGSTVVNECKQGFIFHEASGRCQTPTESFCPHLVFDNTPMQCVDGISRKYQDYLQHGLTGEDEEAIERMNVNNFDEDLLDEDVFRQATANCLEDGSIALGDCLSVYKVCKDGEAVVESCSDGFLFDGKFGACSARCGSMEDSVSASATKPVGDEDELEEDAFRQATSNCLEDGNVALGDCLSVFMVCKDGDAAVESCSDGFLFDTKFGACSANCGSMEDPVSARATKPVGDEDELEEDAFHQATSNCLEDGSIALGDCLSVYMICKDGEAAVESCSDGFLFDTKFGACSENCGAVEDSFVATSAEPSLDNGQLDEDVFRQATSNCLEDGSIALGDCLSVYMICKDGEAAVESCSDGFLFDTKFGACSENCGAVEDSFVATSAEPSLDNGQLDEDVFRQAATNCLEDGVIALGNCLSVYKICKNGEAAVESCSDGFLFDTKFGACSDNCGAVEDSIIATSAEPSLDNGQLDEDVFRQAATNCLEDGVIALGNCLSVYKICKNGEAAVESCSDGFLFDTKFGACSENCGAVEDSFVATSAEPSLDKGQLDEDVLRQRTPNCLEGGVIALGNCLSVYKICKNGEAAVESCSDGFLFDDKFGACSENCGAVVDSFIGTSVEPSLDNGQLDEDVLRQGTPNCLEGGVIALGHCLSVYKICKNGGAAVESCSDGFLFDDKFGACSENCGAVEDSFIGTSVEPSLDNGQLDEDVLRQGTPNCLEGGVIALGHCLSVYKICKNGEAAVESCSDGFLFDDKFGACSENCGAVVDSFIGTSVEPSHDKGQLDEDVFRQGTPSCLEDGVTAIGHCLSVYKICKNGEAAVESCFDGFLFDDKFGVCSEDCGIVEDDHFRDEFKGKPVSRPLLTPFGDGESSKNLRRDGFKGKGNLDLPDRAPFGGSMEDSIIATSVEPYHDEGQLEGITSQRPSFDCTRNGRFSLGECLPVFRVCRNGEAAVVRCSNGFLFDEKWGKCVPRCFADEVHFFVDGNVRDEFKGKPVGSPLLTPFGNGGSSKNLRRDGFKGKGNLDLPVRTPFGYQDFKIHKFDDGFNGKVLRGPVFNPFAHFYEAKPHGYRSRGNDYVEKSGDREGSDKGAYSLDDSNSFGEDLWRSRRSVSSLKCWIAPQSYQPVSFSALTTDSKTDILSDETFVPSPQCFGREDGYQFSSGVCRQVYFVCRHGVAVQESCSRAGMVYSDKALVCVSRSELIECKPIEFTNDSTFAENVNDVDFCKLKSDGFYRHPTECQRVLQCFAETLIEHRSCEHNLAFDERRGVCDYSRNVPGCGEASSPPMDSIVSGCEGHEHGAHVANEGNCSSYFRCVWDRLELMSCPKGTVFNPALSVCDYPNQVPNCANV